MGNFVLWLQYIQTRYLNTTFLFVGYSGSFCSKWGTLTSTSCGTAQDRRRVGFQYNGRKGAKLTNLHLTDHPRRHRWPTWRPEKRGPASLSEWSGVCVIHSMVYILDWAWANSLFQIFFFFLNRQILEIIHSSKKTNAQLDFVSGFLKKGTAITVQKSGSHLLVKSLFINLLHYNLLMRTCKAGQQLSRSLNSSSSALKLSLLKPNKQGSAIRRYQLVAWSCWQQFVHHRDWQDSISGIWINKENQKNQ